MSKHDDDDFWGDEATWSSRTAPTERFDDSPNNEFDATSDTAFDLRDAGQSALALEIARDDGFLERVWRETGLGLEIITADEEVQLAMTGCRPLIEPWARHVVILARRLVRSVGS